MNVLLLNYEFPPAGGGAGFAAFNIGRELVKRGLEVDVLTAYIDGEADGADYEGMRVFRVPSWRKGVHDCGLLGAYSYIFFAMFKRMKLRRANRYDLEHYFFSLPTGVLTLVPTAGKRIPYIVSLRGSDVPGYDPFNRTVESLHRVLAPVNMRIWTRAARVIALSDGLKTIALQSRPRQAIGVIPNGIEEETFCPADRASRPAAGDVVRVVVVSRLLERKGIHHLFQALARRPALPLAVQVIGTGSYEDRLTSECRRLQLHDTVRFRGFVRRESLPDYYKDSDLFVLPSMTESFGLVFAEAMASGLPVIGCRVGGVPELVRHGVDGLLVEPGNVEELRTALEYFVDNRAELSKMGMAARQRILGTYTWRAIAARYQAVYEAAANSNRER